MPKYRKKPVVIDAMQWKGDNLAEIKDFFGGSAWGYGMQYEGNVIAIPTLEGTMEAIVDDYIIKGIKGEFYPCKPDIFKATYERA